MKAKKNVSMKRTVVKTIKTVCTSCQTYTSYDPNENCVICGKNTVRTVGTAFRAPKKGAWPKSLIDMINAGPGPSYGILFGRNHQSGDIFKKGSKAPKKMRERAVIDHYTGNNVFPKAQNESTEMAAKRLMDRFTNATEMRFTKISS